MSVYMAAIADYGKGLVVAADLMASIMGRALTADTHAKGHSFMTPDEVAEFITRWEEDLRAQDPVRLAAHYAANVVADSPIAGHLIGRAALEERWRSLFRTFPQAKIERRDLFIRGNDVVWTAAITAIDRAGLFGQSPTGRRVHLSMVFLFALNGQQIVREEVVYDMHKLLLLLGSDIDAANVAQTYRATLERTRTEQELRIAAEIQRALLPKGHHKGQGFEIVATSVPCRAIGGDFFDFFELPIGMFGFALGDVSGKGPPAALLAAEIQGILAAHSSSTIAPSDALTRANQVLARRPIEARFATISYGVVQPGGYLIHCNAGHNPPILLGANGLRRLNAGGPIFGAFERATFEEETVRLEPGDLLVVFTDGVTEALSPSDEEFGEERLLSCVSANRGLPLAALLESLLDAVREFSGDAVQSDDRTVLVMRYTGL